MILQYDREYDPFGDLHCMTEHDPFGLPDNMIP